MEFDSPRVPLYLKDLSDNLLSPVSCSDDCNPHRCFMSRTPRRGYLTTRQLGYTTRDCFSIEKAYCSHKIGLLLILCHVPHPKSFVRALVVPRLACDGSSESSLSCNFFLPTIV